MKIQNGYIGAKVNQKSKKIEVEFEKSEKILKTTSNITSNTISIDSDGEFYIFKGTLPGESAIIITSEP